MHIQKGNSAKYHQNLYINSFLRRRLRMPAYKRNCVIEKNSCIILDLWYNKQKYVVPKGRTII